MAKKSLFGLSENIAGLLCYVFGFISGIIVLVLERDNKFVRFHALQSTIWFLFLCVTGWVLSLLANIPLLGILVGLVSMVVGLVGFVSWIFLMYKSYKGIEFKLPIIGDVVWAQVNK